MVVREIVSIDPQKCDGCGLCVPSCEEGAIEIVNGKARIVSDVYCDGLGACLGHCPQGAISIKRREAEAFDQQAVAARQRSARQMADPSSPCAGGCPGAAAQRLQRPAVEEKHQLEHAATPPRSRLVNWPVQLHLVPPHASFLQEADLLLVADCVPPACANFHTQILDGHPVVIGCPKLDDCGRYVEKLSAMIEQSRVRSLTVVHMEVPCCTGLLRVAQAAVQQVGASIPVRSIVVTRNGDILRKPAAAGRHFAPAPDVSPARQLPVL